MSWFLRYVKQRLAQDTSPSSDKKCEEEIIDIPLKAETETDARQEATVIWGNMEDERIKAQTEKTPYFDPHVIYKGKLFE